MRRSNKFKIGIWGQLGGKIGIADGQAVRTNTILGVLKQTYDSERIFVVDTYNWKRRPLSLLIKTIKVVKKSENIIVLPANNGFKVVTIILNLINKIYKRNIIYIIIGGFLPSLLEAKPKYIKMVKRFRVLLSQSIEQVKELNALGIENVETFPNFKDFADNESVVIAKNEDVNLKSVFISRIMKEKGVLEAINSIKTVNQTLGGDILRLDFYGTIAPSFVDEFRVLLNENSNIIKYCGVVEFNKTPQVLNKYFLIIFPTYYYGEGQPGVFIDSYFSGVPIIATQWKYNNEFVENGYNGFLVKTHNVHEIAEKILLLYRDRDLHFQMQKNTFNLKDRYAPNKVIKILLNHIN